MSKSGRGSAAANKKKGDRFPWILLLVLLITLYIFWIYPLQKGRPPVKVSFEPAPTHSP